MYIPLLKLGYLRFSCPFSFIKCNFCFIFISPVRDFFETPGAGNGLTYHLSSLLLAGILYLVIITLVESGILQKLYNLAFVSIVGADLEENRRADEDPDIQEERERVDSARNHPGMKT